MKKIDVIEFEKEVLPQILEFFDKTLNDDGKIIDKFTGEVLRDPFTNEELNKDNFAGILPGSSLFISKNLASLAEFITEREIR